MSGTTDMTQGDVKSTILKFFFPMLCTNMLQQFYTVADTAIVGKGLGDDKLAAVGNMSSVTFLIFGFATGLANGFSVIIAQNFGAKDIRRLRQSVAASIRLAVAIAAGLTVLSLTFLRNILKIMQTNELIVDDSLKYGYFIFGGLAVTLSYNLCSGILRALGDSKTPFYAIIASSLVNLALDSLLIFGFGTGVEGAAIATVLSQVISTLICLKKLGSIDEIHLCREDFKGCGVFYGRLIGNGLPMAFMNSITAIGCVVVQSFVNRMGVAFTSAFSACGKFINMFMQPACTAGYTMSAYTSQNYGAKKYDRIKSGLYVCVAIAVTAYVILGSLMIFLPSQLAGIMLSGEEPLSLAAQFLPIAGALLFGVDLLFVFRSGVQGMGHPTLPMISGIVEMVMRISVIITFLDRIGFRATAFAEASAWFGALAINLPAFIYYYRKIKKENIDT